MDLGTSLRQRVRGGRGKAEEDKAEEQRATDPSQITEGHSPSRHKASPACSLLLVTGQQIQLSRLTRHSSLAIIIIIIIISPLTARVVGAPQVILQPVFSSFPCSPLPSGTCRPPGLSIPWCCLPTSSSVCLVFFPLSLCLARWFWPDLMNGKHDHTTAV